MIPLNLNLKLVICSNYTLLTCISSRMDSQKERNTTQQESVVNVQNPPMIGQTVNAKKRINKNPNWKSYENQVSLKEPYTNQDESPTKDRRLDLFDETGNSWEMDPSLIEYANKCILFISNQVLPDVVLKEQSSWIPVWRSICRCRSRKLV